MSKDNKYITTVFTNFLTFYLNFSFGGSIHINIALFIKILSPFTIKKYIPLD
jgi:hypothetical protein